MQELKRLLAITGWLALASVGNAVAQTDSLPAEPQAQSPAAESVQGEVQSKSAEKAAERRKAIIREAVTALQKSNEALAALDAGKKDEALAALEIVTGKLELILARDPDLAFAPVDVKVVTYDLLASTDTVKAIIHDAEDYLDDGEIQKARPLVSALASEIQVRETSIPLATYPEAVKGVVKLIDEDKLDEAREALQLALNTVVTRTVDVIPLPKLRAERLLANAEKLAENKDRTAADEQTLKDLLAEARRQLELAQLLGYGDKKAYEPMYEQLDSIEQKVAEGKSGKGWFDRLKEQLEALA
ncbi:MAG: hypothetical protein D6727_08965 [Gammaproteobacteria bacterium]|nr:MAG: hypothetical protein D6727_08965 [Gammaproteobacteria bacterium]